MPKYDTFGVILGIFSNFPERIAEYRHDREKMHAFFYKNKSKYAVLSGFAFDTDGLTPFSPQINSSYDTLEVSRLVCSRSLDFDIHRVDTAACRIGFDKFHKKKFSKSKIAEMKKLSEEFRKEFSLESVLQ